MAVEFALTFKRKAQEEVGPERSLTGGKLNVDMSFLNGVI